MSDLITMTREELTALIDERVQSAIAAIGTRKVARGVARQNRPSKLYDGKSGNYFEVDLMQLGEVDADLAMRLLAVVSDETIFEQDSSLARAIKAYAASHNKVIMWAANQDYLIVGNHRSGQKERVEGEKFRIPQELLEDLGHFSPNNAEGVARGLLEVKSRIGFEDFVRAEAFEKNQDKMAEKLRKLGGRS